MLGFIFSRSNFLNKTYVAPKKDLSGARIEKWLKGFLEKDFDTCDSMIYENTDKLYSGQVVALFDDEEYYDEVMDKLVDCITSAKIVSADKLGSIATYMINIKYKPYVKINSLEVDKTSLIDDIDKYLDGEKVNMQKKLDKLYLKIFKDNCFQVSEDTEEQELTLKLTEKVESDGNYILGGTVEFVDKLLKKSKILNNTEVYESQVKNEVYEVIAAY
jgi:hypothetical protein